MKPIAICELEIAILIVANKIRNRMLKINPKIFKRLNYFLNLNSQGMISLPRCFFVSTYLEKRENKGTEGMVVLLAKRDLIISV